MRSKPSIEAAHNMSLTRSFLPSMLFLTVQKVKLIFQSLWGMQFSHSTLRATTCRISTWEEGRRGVGLSSPFRLQRQRNFLLNFDTLQSFKPLSARGVEHFWGQRCLSLSRPPTSKLQENTPFWNHWSEQATQFPPKSWRAFLTPNQRFVLARPSELISSTRSAPCQFWFDPAHSPVLITWFTMMQTMPSSLQISISFLAQSAPYITCQSPLLHYIRNESLECKTYMQYRWQERGSMVIMLHILMTVSIALKYKFAVSEGAD